MIFLLWRKLFPPGSTRDSSQASPRIFWPLLYGPKILRKDSYEKAKRLWEMPGRSHRWIPKGRASSKKEKTSRVASF